MVAAEDVVRAAAEGRLRDVHDLLVAATTDHENPPENLLSQVAAALADDQAERLPPRAAVVIRLLEAGALDAAWHVVRDNAVGVVQRAVRTSTSSGARPSGTRLPLATYVEPPAVYAWLPGFRDPRFAAPDSAYDVTSAVTATVRLDEAWWDGSVLVMSGLASLRHLDTSLDDEVSVVLRNSEREQTVRCVRLRRPDLVTGSGAGLTRRAWAGWTARVDASALARGSWTASLRVVQRGIERQVRLGDTRLDVVPKTEVTHAGPRAATRIGRDGLTITVGSALLALRPRQLLQAVANRALRR